MQDSLFTNIIKEIHLREEMLSPYACKSISGIRLDPGREKIPDSENIRPSFTHDSDKIMHSKAYTRYMDKTQVFSLFENDHLTQRSLHVQFVSKIGRTVARALKLNEDLVEAIALGHDLGHPPFGHDGESFLNEICERSGIGFFVHNAQSVRTMMEIENDSYGLNLSVQVLDGFLAHNGEMISRQYAPDFNKTKDDFLSEYKRSFAEKGTSAGILPMTLEGCVARISDIIAYIGRDIEDAIRVHLIKRESIPAEAVRILGNRNDTIINTLVTDLITNSYDKAYITLSPEVYEALDILKKFNYDAIYLNPLIKKENAKVRVMFNAVFDHLAQDIKNDNRSSKFYEFFHSGRNERYFAETGTDRMIIDFIASMTNDFFLNFYSEIFMPKRFGYHI